jgi:hypothetical protein
MRLIVGLVAVAALGGVAWVLLRADEASVAPVEDALKRGDKREGEAPSLAGVGSTSGGVSAAHDGRCGLLVVVTRDGKPAVAEVDLRSLAGPEWLDSDAEGLTWPFRAADPPGRVVVQGASDVEGRLAFSGLAPGVYHVTARTPDGARGAANAALQIDGIRVLVSVELLPSDLVLEGRVVWSDGKPFAGTVVLQSHRGLRGPAFRGRVGTEGSVATPLAPDGTFRLAGLGAGPHAFRALQSDGLLAVVSDITLPRSEPYRLVIERGGLQLQGRVVDGVSEAPIPGATVSVESGEAYGGWLCHLLTSDAEGRFRANVSGLTTRIQVEAAGYGPADRQVENAGADVVLRLHKSARIAGRVTSVGGSPAAGARVVVRSKGLRDSSEESVVADATGHYAIEAVPPGEVTVMVCGGGWLSPGLLDADGNGYNPFVHAVVAGARLSLDLTAVAGGRMEGRVLDAAGAPVAGALVRAAPLSSDPFESIRGITRGLGADTAASDPVGAFALDGLIPELPYKVTALAPGHALGTSGPHAVSAGVPLHVEIRLPAPRMVDLEVLFEDDGTPVAGARATLLGTRVSSAFDWDARGRSLAAPTTWTTDAEGRARLGPAPPGALFVRVESDDLVGAGRAVTWTRGKGAPDRSVAVEGSEDGEGPFAVTLRLPRGLTIEGRVLTHDGKPAPKAFVSAMPAGGKNASTSHADDEGAFVLRGLASGEHKVSATWRVGGQKYLRADTTSSAGARGLTLTLSERPVEGEGRPGRGARTLVVRVVDDRGRPVPSAQVTVSTSSGSTGGTVHSGVAEVDVSQLLRGGIRAGVIVLAWGARGEDGLPLPLGPARVGPFEVGDGGIDVRLPAERAIAGRVLTESGAPVPGVLVSARPVGTADAHVPERMGTAYTDRQGRFRVGRLGEGDYVLEVEVPPDFVAPGDETAAAGSTEVTFRVRPAPSVLVRVLGDDGRPLARARVAVTVPMPKFAPGEDFLRLHRQWERLREASSRSAITGSDGTARLRGLDPALRLQLGVTGPEGADEFQPFVHTAWVPADVEVRLSRGYAVSGVVRDGKGGAVPGARVQWKTGAGAWAHLEAQPDGSFRITGLPSGPVTLRAQPRSAMSRGARDLPETTVPAGSSDVVLVTDPGVELVVRVTNLEETDWAPDVRRLAIAMVARDGRWQQAGAVWDDASAGRFRFEGMSPSERYRIWIQPKESLWYGLAADVVAGEGDATIRAQRGGAIRGRITAPVGAVTVNVQLGNDDGLMIHAHPVDIEGRYEVRGVPEGRWTVRAYGRVDGKPWQAEGTVATGGTLDLTLEERVR